MQPSFHFNNIIIKSIKRQVCVSASLRWFLFHLAMLFFLQLIIEKPEYTNIYRFNLLKDKSLLTPSPIEASG